MKDDLTLLNDFANNADLQHLSLSTIELIHTACLVDFSRGKFIEWIDRGIAPNATIKEIDRAIEIAHEVFEKALERVSERAVTFEIGLALAEDYGVEEDYKSIFTQEMQEYDDEHPASASALYQLGLISFIQTNK